MSEMKILIIDDDGEDIEKLSDYLGGIDVQSLNICAQIFGRVDMSGKKLTPDEQYDKAKKFLSESWTKCDIFLIDIFLLGPLKLPQEEPMVSQRIFEDLLKEDDTFKKAIKNGKKMVVFVTRNGSLPSTFKDEVEQIKKNYWHIEDKPDFGAGEVTKKAICEHDTYCENKPCKHDKTWTRARCLGERIITFATKGAPTYESS